jgi:glycosyltransferase involved in cell wall biosynthesis
MRYSNTLVSVGLPVRNGAERLAHVVESVLNQDHENLELVVCDNASTDDTEELCRDLAARDSRIVYHRHPVNVGMLNNFISALRLAAGTFYRWVGDDDWLDPRCVSRSLDAFAADDRLLLVTTQISYVGADGVGRTVPYDGTALGSDDPVTRFTEMLRLQNTLVTRFTDMLRLQHEYFLLVDPLYGMFRREPVMRIERRKIPNEDQVFAAKLALAGPWAHVPEVLIRRNWEYERRPNLARKLGVPSWHAYFDTELQCKELLRVLDQCDLDQQQRRRARLAVGRLYVRRQQYTLAQRSRKLVRIARQLAIPLGRKN